MAINWGGNVDQLMASWQKPIGTYGSVFTLMYLAIFIPDTRGIVIPILGALAGFNGGARTYEKITAMKSNTTTTTTPPTTTVSTSVPPAAAAAAKTG